jgi:hypothetical protein
MRVQFYLRLKDVPELAPLTPAERRRLWFKYVRHSPHGVRGWGAFLLVWLPFGIPLLYPTWWMFFVVAPAVALPLVAHFNRVQVEQLRPYFREHLASRCAACDYDLRATPDRCPECGTVTRRPA